VTGAQRTLGALFAIVTEHTAWLVERVGARETSERLRGVQELIARLPHKYLLAANRDEIRSAGLAMAREGRSQAEMRALNDTLLGLFERACAAGALSSNPLRDRGEHASHPPAAPEAALVVGVPQPQVEAIRDLLGPLHVEVHPVSTHTEALESVRWFPFAYVLATMPPVAPTRFLESVRVQGSLCRTAGVVLLVRGALEGEANHYVGRGANRVIPLGDVDGRLPQAITELGAVSERTRVRLAVEVDLDHGRRCETWQSENLSASGMLLRTSTPAPIGREVGLHFTLPGDDLPIHVHARVVRGTTFAREDFDGLAVHFLSFVGEGQHRLELLLRRQRS
jgi:HAMP domain-containing protein